MTLMVFCNAQNVYIASPWLKANMLATNTTTNLRAKDLSGNWLKIDQNSDGEIQLSEALNVSYYYDANAHVTSYEGINSFTNLEYLYFAYNPIPTSLDVSGLNNLKLLNCYFNNLTAINLGGCASLETLNLNMNYLTWLDASWLPNLKYLDCQNNRLIHLGLPSTPSLVNVTCFSNRLTSLNLDNQTNLEVLNCSGNLLTNLTLANCPNLNQLNCNSNRLQTLNVDSAISLASLTCGSNFLQTLNVSNSSLLNYLNCQNNNLVSLNINNGFNWIASNESPGNFVGSYNPNISQVCTSAASVPTIINYYLSAAPSVSNCTALGVEENLIDKVIFYPNPAKEKIFFSKDLNLVSVYDMKGALMKNCPINDREMNISELAVGLYILEIQSDNEITYRKLVIE